MRPSEQAQADVIRKLREAGWVDDGATQSEIVRMPVDCFGGRHDVQVGGRMRLRLPDSDRRVTVGPRTTCFYRVVGGSPREFVNLRTMHDLTKIVGESIRR